MTVLIKKRPGDESCVPFIISIGKTQTVAIGEAIFVWLLDDRLQKGLIARGVIEARTVDALGVQNCSIIDLVIASKWIRNENPASKKFDEIENFLRRKLFRQNAILYYDISDDEADYLNGVVCS